jgi:hypothetical protein
MGDGCGLRAMSFPGFQKNRSCFVLWSFEGARCGLEVLFFLMVKMNWCVVTHHKCQRVCLRADVMRGAAVRWSIFKPSGITWRLGKCDQTKVQSASHERK